MSQNEFSAGLTLRGDDSFQGEFRIDNTSALVTSDGHSYFYEPSSRGQVFSVGTTLLGTSIQTAVNAPPAAGQRTLLSILNPIGSGLNLEIVRGWVFRISGNYSPAVGGLWTWCGALAGNSITAAESTTPQVFRNCNQVSAATSRIKAWSMVDLTGGPDQVLVKPVTSYFPANMAVALPDLVAVDNVNGSIVVPPGGLLSIAPPDAGGSATAFFSACIQYTEVPRTRRTP